MKRIIYLLPVVYSVLLLSCVSEKLSDDENKNPNILIIMADDLGYSDIGCYGGEIHTPNLDGLAENGVRFTQFYNAARCCPTRASLLTGKYPHQVGLARNGQTLSRNAATIAEVLKKNGYHTGMAGKWHLSRTKALEDKDDQLLWLSHRLDSSVFAPVESYPSNRGFDEHWGVIWGVVNFFDPFSLVHNEEEIKDVSDDFYMTDFITDKSIEMVDEFSKDDDPFFLYVAHTAPHWPLHALPEDIEKYKGVYDEGWEKLRETRYQGLIDKGIINNPEVAPNARNESGNSWSDCERKGWEARHMEAHAAMVDRLDHGVGRLIQKLKETGEFENTVILFLADNGASPERGYQPGFDRPGHTREGEEIVYDDFERPGPEKTWGYLGVSWAGAINAPFRYWKKESFEGGNCTPFIVHWPAGLNNKKNEINRGVGHVIDILPTCLELAETDYPELVNGLDTSPVEGKSIMPLLRGEVSATHDTLFWEHEGGKALRIGDWKIATLRDYNWELFNLAENRTETENLASQYPEKVKEMEAVWKRYYKRIYTDQN
ncbi:sulfatase-like hydrolase/transferase [Maribellus comscasis]|uniref:Sulfatase-like hydrolase/transferase n=1 Tax=Maribellus comscasis TaxID=2681766 RepID=A0A6I6JWQ3_9BACT|nr:arylsulfatase [Maribellus comscasis]QGY47555.1 sulfatase-like hydrolase/transferase [Maribellus comscasis]